MILTLEVSGQHALNLGAGSRKVFHSAGGQIGRLPDNDWVLPDPYVSGHHARVQYRNGQFWLEDTSSNGVFVNSPENRLTRGKLHPLQSGDRLFIDVYEIRVTVSPDVPEQDPFASVPKGVLTGRTAPIPDDPFGLEASAEPLVGTAETDPLRALGIDDRKPPKAAPAPRAADLAGSSPLSQHYRPPEFEIEAPPLAEPPGSQEPHEAQGLIPSDYDPLATGDPGKPSPVVPQRPAAAKVGSGPVLSVPPPATPPHPKARPPQGLSQGASRRIPAPPPAAVGTVSSRPPVTATPASGAAELDFEAFLQGAGLQGVDVSPELARTFGEILKVVIGGLMDILRARERIKDEFRMRMTTFKAADNNPLKFSANVEDALHNLLVKRNPAYLAPVEAFEDAFRDARNHQLAMLAGVRIAYEFMLQEFEPERLQEEFDRQIKASSFLSAAGRLRYWDLYRDRFSDRTKDADSCFRDLFGDEFARAYEEQFEKLRTLHRAEGK
jgi:type VI secretion system FHA domain protein